jgi:hypothetical protein
MRQRDILHPRLCEHPCTVVGEVTNPAINKGTVVLHFILPGLMPALFFAVALSPVDLLGCKTRGLIALSIAFVSGLAGLGAAVMAMKGRTRREAGSEKWIFTALIFTIPVVAMLVMA